MTLTLCKKMGGVESFMNYEFNLMQYQYVGVVTKRLCAAAETSAAAHEVDDNTCIPSRGKNYFILRLL